MIVILGASASGKSTMQNMLVDSNPSKYKKVITYTTRPMRPGERDGVDYHFISSKRFNELERSGFFAESASYRDWKYGTAKEDCDNEYAVAVLTPPGLRSMRARGVKTTSIYICVDRASRLVSIIQRGDNIDEAYRRSLSDVGMFSELQNEVDYTIYNNNFSLSKEEVLEQIKSIVEK